MNAGWITIGMLSSAFASQVPLLPEDLEHDEALFPRDRHDVNLQQVRTYVSLVVVGGHPACLGVLSVSFVYTFFDLNVPFAKLDLRTRNSWVMKLEEIQVPELAEVFAINSMAPFILNGRLKSLMEQSPAKVRLHMHLCKDTAYLTALW